jgi:hypothetical protein
MPPHSLDDFVRAWFHPDWDRDAANADEVIDEFLAVAGPNELDDVRRDAERLLEGTPDDTVLCARLLDSGLSWAPRSDELATRSWLRHLVDRLTPR